MYTAVCINANASDDWVNNSPISGVSLLTGRLGFVFSNIEAFATPNSYHAAVPGKLLSVGNISKEVEIFSSVSKELTMNTIEGIGGVAKTNDFTFELESISGDIDFLRLIGRVVQVYVGTSNYVEEIEHITSTKKFIGRISGVNPGRESYSINVTGNFSKWDKEIGTYITTDVDLYKNKIIPIIYGDFSDSSGYLPSVANTSPDKLPTIYFDNRPIVGLSKLKVFDPISNRPIYVSEDLSKFSVNADNNTVDMVGSISSVHLQIDINASATSISIFNPFFFKVEFSESISSVTAHTTSAGGDIYQDENGVPHEYLGGNFWSNNSLSDGGFFNLWTRVSGTGPSTLTVINRFACTKQWLDLKQYLRDDVVKSEVVFIKIGNEVIQIICQLGDNVNSSNRYLYSTYLVLRGINSTPASHVAGTLVYSSDETIKDGKLIFEHSFWPSDIVNWGSNNSFEHILTFYQSGHEDDRLSITSYPDAIKHLTAMQRFGQLGQQIYFGDGLDADTIQLDMKFPECSLKGTVIDAYLLGEYSYWLVDNAPNYLLLRRGGLVTWIDSMYARITPYLWTPGEGDIYPEYGFITDLGTFGVGYWVDDVNPMPPTGGLVRIKTLPFIVGNYEEVVQLLVSHYNSGELSDPELRNFVAQRNHPEALMLLGQVDYKKFSLKNRYHTKIINNVLVEEPNAYGISEDLSGFLSSRFFFEFSKTGAGSLILSNPGLLVQFSSDAIEQVIYASGQGRVDSESHLIENAAAVVEDFLIKEVGLTTANFDSSSMINAKLKLSGIKTTLLIHGGKQKSFSILDKFAKETGLIISENSLGLVTVDSIEQPADDEVLQQLTDVTLYLDGKNILDYSEEFTEIEKLITNLTILYAKNFASIDNELFSKTVTETQWADVLAFLGNSNSVTIKSDHYRDTASVQHLVDLVKQYYSYPFRIITFICKIEENLRIGQWVRITNGLLKSVDNKYLIVATDEQLPSTTEMPGVTCTAIEFSYLHSLDEVIREIPGLVTDSDADEEIDGDLDTNSYEEIT